MVRFSKMIWMLIVNPEVFVIFQQNCLYDSRTVDWIMVIFPHNVVLTHGLFLKFPDRKSRFLKFFSAVPVHFQGLLVDSNN